MFLHRGRERTGELFVLSAFLFEGLYPAIAHASSKQFPPFLFIALSLLLSSVIHVLIASAQGVLRSIRRSELRDIVGVIVCIVLVPTITTFLGTRLTSGITTALLLQAEVPFAIILCWFLGDRLRRGQLAGVGISLLGALLVLFRGMLSLHLGDLLILAGTAVIPFGNLFAKRVLGTLDPSTLLFYRSFLSGIAFFGLSALFERNFELSAGGRQSLWLIPAYGILVLVCSKTLWYQGLRRLSVSKASSLVTVGPLFSFTFASLFLRELPTPHQMLGLLLILLGSALIAFSPSPSPRPEPL